MIKLEHCEIMGWEHVIRGMRNPKNSWALSDSTMSTQAIEEGWADLGEKDHKLMMNLRNAGTDHRKFMRMITVYVDITAPLYWWKEFDTYKVGTVANSCSTMHKIHERDLTLEDFSHEKLITEFDINLKHTSEEFLGLNLALLKDIIDVLNWDRKKFLETNDKKYWDSMIQLLPTSYNQKRTVMLNYEVLANMYKSRKNHKLDEWRELCKWIEDLPYSELITGEVRDAK